jgi:UDP-glucose 4-epimerase
MNFDLVFFGFGDITKNLINRYILNQENICVISNNPNLLKTNLKHSKTNRNLITLDWKTAIKSEISSNTTFIAWRDLKYFLNIETRTWINSHKYKTKKIIHLSSASVYEPLKEKFKEIDFLIKIDNLVEFEKQRNFNSKQLLEAKLQWLSKIKQADLINLRISNVYGKNLSKGFINESVSNILNNRPVQLYSDINPIRDYLFIDDLTFAITQLNMLNLHSSDINISTGVGLASTEVVEALYSKSIIDFQTIEIKSPNNLQQKSVLDCSKLEKLIRWNPQQVEFVIPLLFTS